MNLLRRVLPPVLLTMAFYVLTLAQTPAGYTVVTGVVKDPFGCVYTNAPYTVQLVDLGTNNQLILLNGQAFQKVFTGYQTDSFGNFSITIADNSVLDLSGDTGSSWTFTFCSSQYTQPSQQKYCFNYNTRVSGATVNLSTQLQAVAATLPACPTGTGGSLNGSGIQNFITKWTGTTTLGDSTGFDNGTSPVTWPNGLNTELSGNYDQWTADAGGTQANKLVCRSSNNLAQTCATNATNGVLGVAVETVSVGGTVDVCWAAHCQVTVTNASTAGHWLIPSTSVAGAVDDTGSFTEPIATQTFLSESNALAGTLVKTTILSPDTTGANAGGAGTVTSVGLTMPSTYSVSGSPVTSSGTLGVTWNVAGPDYIPTSTAANAVSFEQVNGGSSCGDSTHALSYSTSTHQIGCQAISASGSTAFSSITSGVNTIPATMTVGNGSSIGSSGTGTVSANQAQLPTGQSFTGGDCLGATTSTNVSPIGDAGLCGGLVVGPAFGVNNIGNAPYTLQVSDNRKTLVAQPSAARVITLPQPSSGTGAFISQASANCNSGGGPITTCSTSLSVTAGNQLRVTVGVQVASPTGVGSGTTPPNITISDGGFGNTYTNLYSGPGWATTTGGVDGNGGAAGYSWISFNIVSTGSVTVTSSCNSNCGTSSNSTQISLIQYNLISAKDSAATVAATRGNPPNNVLSQSVTTNSNNDVIFASSEGNCLGNGSSSFGPGLTARFNLAGSNGNTLGGDGIAQFPGSQTYTTATSGCGVQSMELVSLKSSATLNFLNGFWFQIRNSGTAPLVLTPTSSVIFTQWYAGLTSGATVSLYPNQSAFCESDAVNWQCYVIGNSNNSSSSPVTVNANVSTDQNLMSYPVKANTLNQVNNTLHVWGGGIYTTAAANTSTITVKAKLGSVTLATWTSAANLGGQTNDAWNIDLTFTSTATGTAGFKAHGNLTIGGITAAATGTVYPDVNTGTTGTVDQTVDQTLQITIAFSSASASNSATQDQLVSTQVN